MSLNRDRSQSYKVALVGLGGIGLGYDSALPINERGLTHFGAIVNSPDFEFLVGVDPFQSSRDMLTSYGYDAVESIDKYTGLIRPDLVIIASPTNQHLTSIRTVLNLWSPQAVLLEKPIASNLSDSIEITNLLADAKIPSFINFPRRISPGAIEIRKRIADGDFQFPARAVVWYGGDLLNSGIHFLDLLEYWFGSLQSQNPPHFNKPGHFHFANQNIDAIFVPNVTGNYVHNSMDILFQNGRLTLGSRDAGFDWYPVENDTIFTGFTVVGNNSQHFEMEIRNLQKITLGYLSDELKGMQTPLCTVNEGLQSLTTVFNALS